MVSIASIQSRLKKLEKAVIKTGIPSEQEFRERWSGFDELSKSVYIACAENRMWELEADPQAKKYFEVCSGYLISAGLAKVGKSILEIAAELEAKKHGL